MGSWLPHGWHAFEMAYAAAQVPMFVALTRGRVALNQYILSPLVAAPLAGLAICGAAMTGATLGHFGVVHADAAQLAVATLLSATLGYSGGRSIRNEGASDAAHRRGSVVSDRPSGRARRDEGESKSWGSALTLAGQEISPHDETKHFKMIGTTGTGKSTAIHEMMSAALARGDRAVIADPDGGYLRRLYREERGDVVLNPFDARSVKWDLFAEIKNDYDVEQLARSLIPDHDGQDKSWRAYARTFFSAVTRQAHGAGITDVGELYRLLVVAEASELRGLVRGTAAQPFLDEHNSRMFDSIRSVTSSAVSALEYVSQQKAPGFSVREWTSGGSTGVLFIPYKASQIAALRSTISGWMRLAIFEAMSHDESPAVSTVEQNQRLWFVVDELDALGQIDGLKDALARVRKFGGRCVLGFQSIAQVSGTYGAGDAHTIVENCGNTLILRCSASEGGGTARFASQLIGDREVLRTTVSKSRRPGEWFSSVTHSQHINVEPAVLPSQVEQLPDLAGYLKYASDPVWRRVRLEARQEWQHRRSGLLARIGADPSSRSQMLGGSEYD
jgi:Type IV secretion-system coupling protein DNA-binding domain